MMYLPAPAVTALLLGPVVGSAIGVLAAQWPPDGRALWGRSACARCGHRLNVAELVPLLSFAWLLGRCRHCGSPIGWEVLGVEVAGLAAAAAAAWANAGGPATLPDAALGWALLAAAWIDVRVMLLPDAITLPLLLAGLAETAWSDPASLTAHAAAAALGYAGLRGLNAAYRALRRRDGLGAGDAKLLAAAGAWLGPLALPDMLLAAGLLGLAQAAALAVLRRWPRDGRLAFGPALALAFFGTRLVIAAAGPG